MQTPTGVILRVWPMGRWSASPLEAGPIGARWAPAVRWAAIEDTACWGKGQFSASPTDAGLGRLTAAVCGSWDFQFPTKDESDDIQQIHEKAKTNNEYVHANKDCL